MAKKVLQVFFDTSGKRPSMQNFVESVNLNQSICWILRYVWKSSVFQDHHIQVVCSHMDGIPISDMHVKMLIK